MGAYDEVGDRYLQIKSAQCEMKHYPVGSNINLADGIHVCYEGWFLVCDGVVIEEGTSMYDKWGGKLNLEIVLHPASPIARAIEADKEKGCTTEDV